MCISEVSLQLLVSRAVITASLSDWNCMCFPCQCLPKIAHDRRLTSAANVTKSLLSHSVPTAHVQVVTPPTVNLV